MARNTLLYALLIAAAMLGGCAAAPIALGAAGGAATFQYLENQEVREYPRPFSDVFDATLAALRDLDYPAPAMTLPEHEEAKMTSKDVSVALAHFSGGLTRVAVRVGVFKTGDHRRRAELLHEAIAKNLDGPQALPAATPVEAIAVR